MLYSGKHMESDSNGWLGTWTGPQQFKDARDIGDSGILVSPGPLQEHLGVKPRLNDLIKNEIAWRQPPPASRATASRLLTARWQSADPGTREADAETTTDGYVVGLALRPMNIQLLVAGRLVHDGAASPGMMHVSEPATSAHCLFRGQYDALHIFVSHDLLREYGGNASVLRATPGLVRDPVIQQLGLTLLKAEACGTVFASLYIDGINIAIVTRLLALQAATQAAPGQPRIAKLARWRLKRAIDYIDAHLAEPVSLADIATAAGLSRMHFAAQFKAATGHRPHDYLLHRRVVQAQHLLVASAVPVVDVALEVGFETQAHFTTVFKRLVGLPPHAWRQSRAPDRTLNRSPAGPAISPKRAAPEGTGTERAWPGACIVQK